MPVYRNVKNLSTAKNRNLGLAAAFALGTSLFLSTGARAASLLFDTTPNIGRAGGYSLLSTEVSVTDNVAGGSKITGDVGVGPHGQLNINNGGSVTGVGYLDNSSAPNASLAGGSSVPGGGTQLRNLAGAVADAESASSGLAANGTWNQTFNTGINTNSAALTITQTTTLTYVDIIGDLVTGNGHALTFQASSANDFFVVNVTGKVSILGGGVSVSGIDPSHLFISSRSTDATGAVVITNGAAANGIFLATLGGMSLGSGTLKGAVIGDGTSITVNNGFQLTGDPSPFVAPVPLPTAASSGLLALGGLGLVAGFRRFHRKSGAIA
jgi:hypothetical protein